MRSFHIDKCRDYEYVWFDAGELARLQLDFEATLQGQEAAYFQEQLRNMTPKETQQFAIDLGKFQDHIDDGGSSGRDPDDFLTASADEMLSNFAKHVVPKTDRRGISGPHN